MKLLFDENLSRRLVARLADLFPESSHVVLEGLLQNPDIVVWEYAKAQGFVAVTMLRRDLATVRDNHPLMPVNLDDRAIERLDIDLSAHCHVACELGL